MFRPFHILALTASLALGVGCAFRPIFHPPTDQSGDSGLYAASDAASARDSTTSSDAGIAGDFCDIPLADGGHITVSRESGLCGNQDAGTPGTDASFVDSTAPDVSEDTGPGGDASDVASDGDAGTTPADGAASDSETTEAGGTDGGTGDALGGDDASAIDASTD